MIAGVGVDIASVPRFEGKERRFYERFLNPEEMRTDIKAEYAASRFAAKEAFSKAIGTGVRGFSLREVIVREDSLGKPFLAFQGKALALSAGRRFFLSLSHDSNLAVAFVVAEYEE